jgi:hypothetical protein
MKNRGNIKSLSLGLILFFVVSTFAHISKADAHIYSKIDYTRNSNPSSIELVITSSHKGFSAWNSYTGTAKDYSLSIVQTPHFSRLFILDYNRCVIQKLKTQTTNKPYQKNLVAILQKKNTSHQSGKADPPLS